MSTPFLNLTTKTYRKLMSWTMQARLQSSEVSGFGEIEAELLTFEGDKFLGSKPFTPFKKPITIEEFDKKTGDNHWIRFTLKDVWFLSGSKNTATDTNITPEAAREFFEKRTAENLDNSLIKCWWHCHPMPTGWSGTDETAIRQTPMGGIPQVVRWQVSIVHTNVDGWIARYDQFDHDIHWHIPVAVENEIESIEKDCYEQVKIALKKEVVAFPNWSRLLPGNTSNQPPPLNYDEIFGLVADYEQYAHDNSDRASRVTPMDFDGEVFEQIGQCGACENPIMACLDTGEIYCAECGETFELPISDIGDGMCPQCGDELIMSQDGTTVECSECKNVYDAEVYWQYHEEKSRKR